MTGRPLILLTNDDGVESPGLHAAVAAVAELGELLIVAPETQQTSMGRSYPRGPRTGIITPVPLCVAGHALTAFAVAGSPAQAVAHAVLELADRLPDLCVSGINYGENVGGALGASGTVGAAFEATAYRIPALAVSRQSELDTHYAARYPKLNFSAAAHFTRCLAHHLLTDGLPPETTLLNLNIPETATPDTPIRLTRQSRQPYFELRRPPVRNLDQPFELITTVQVDRARLEPDSDIHALIVDQAVSVTPLTWSSTSPAAESGSPAMIRLVAGRASGESL